MPKLTVPFKYLILYFVAVTCDGVALCRYPESILVIVDKSGRVLILNQCKEPTYHRKSFSILILTCCGRIISSLILSSGEPARYGVVFDVAEISDKPTLSINSNEVDC